MIRVRPSAVALLAAFAAAAGCGPQTMPALPKTVPVKGKVIGADGRPLDGGRVIFHSTDPAQKTYEGWAELEKDGSFQVTSWAPNDGLMPGTYTVTLSPNSLKTADAKVVNAGRIPRAYRDDGTTPWKVTVESSATELPPHTIK